VDRLKTSLDSDEILTRVTIPIPTRPVGMAYAKLRHPSSGYALVGVAAMVGVDRDGLCSSCRVAVTGAGPKARLIEASCSALIGRRLTPRTIREAATTASDDLSLSGDIYAGEEYRAHLVRVYVERVLLTATSRIPAL
jgi:carbon-monoxide dehydrogenase medium subunit